MSEALSIQLPAELWELLRKYREELRSGQVTIEFRNGIPVAYESRDKRRLATGVVPEVLETKAR